MRRPWRSPEPRLPSCQTCFSPSSSSSLPLRAGRRAPAFAWLGQPPVIGEVLAGILLGPSFLGAIAPAEFGQLLSPDVIGHLNILAQLGVILYLFVVGLELDTGRLAHQGIDSFAISSVGMAVPFLLGSTLAASWPCTPPPRDQQAVPPFTVFALFMASVAMSVTALPHRAGAHPDRQSVDRHALRRSGP